MPITQEQMTVRFEGEAHVVPSDTATVTVPLPDAVVRATIASVVTRADDDLADDLMIAVEVRRRDLSDRGERISLEDFIRLQGYDLAEFGPAHSLDKR